MKKALSLITVFALILVTLFSFTACQKAGGVKIAVPNDTANEIRALKLLEANGYLKLNADFPEADLKKNITENPYNIEIVEAEAATLPNVLKDVDFAIINSNYAIDAGLNPSEEALLIEGANSSAYGNILAVKEGNENAPIILALKAALESKKVADFIEEKYGKSVLSTVENPTDGYDASIDYVALSGQKVSVAASPAPHAEILAVAKEILAAKNITLEIKEFTDYVQPNTVVESGEIDANYFQHQPYLDSFNEENGTHVVNVATIHVEPLCLYAGKSSSLDAIK